MKQLRYISVLVLLCVLMPGIAVAQRRISPVKTVPSTQGTRTEKRERDSRANVVERTDAQGKIVFVDTVTGLEFVDSTAMPKVKKMIYPLWQSVDVGVNIWDPVMRILGQHYGLFDIWAELNLHNRYKPVVEIGVGNCNDTPDGMNFTYKSKLAPYFKIGANYNIFYNSNPDYQFNAGVRFGFSSFSYEVDNITVDEGYWGDPAHFSIPSQSTTAAYFEVVAGVKVKIVGPLSLGWMVRYHTLFSTGNPKYGKPMYIPGYGKRGSSISASFSVIYTIPLNKQRPKKVNTEGDGEDDEE